MVAVPAIKDCFECVVWNGASQMEGGLSVVRLPNGMSIQGL